MSEDTTIELPITLVANDMEPVPLTDEALLNELLADHGREFRRLELHLAHPDVSLSTNFAKLCPKLTELFVIGGGVGPSVLRHPCLEDVYLEGCRLAGPKLLKLAGTARAGGARLQRATLVGCDFVPDEVWFGPGAKLVRFDVRYKGKPRLGTISRFTFKGCAHLGVIAIRCSVPYSVVLEGKLPLLKKLTLTPKKAATLNSARLTGASPLAAKQLALQKPAVPSTKTVSDVQAAKALRRYGFTAKKVDGAWEVKPQSTGSGWQRRPMPVSDIPTDELQALGNIRSIAIDSLKAKHLSALCDIPSLKTLEGLTLTSLAKLSIDPIAEAFAKLLVLELSYDSGGSELSALSKLKHLQRLRIQANVQDLSFVGTLRNLVALDLSGCTRVCDIGPVGALKKLEVLDLANCERLTDIGDVDQLLPRLTKLSVWRIADPRADDIERAFRKLRRARKK